MVAAGFCQPGTKRYHSMIATRIRRLTRKSTRAVTTVATGMMTRGKYTLPIRLAFETSCLRPRPARRKTGTTATSQRRPSTRRHFPLARQLGERPEYDCEHNHRKERPQHRPGHADQRLLVAHATSRHARIRNNSRKCHSRANSAPPRAPASMMRNRFLHACFRLENPPGRCRRDSW